MSELPSLRALRYFHQAALQLSFSQAAQSLNVTHSAVSHQIRQLEAWLGRPLFLRAGGRVQLTPDGERLKICCVQTFGEIAAACEKIRGQGAPGLTLSCAPSFLAQWLIPRVDRFSRRHGDIPLNFQTHVDIGRVRSGQCDLLIVSHQRPVGEDIAASLLAVDAIGPVCAPSLAARFSDGDGLSALPLLHADTRPNAWAEWAEKTGARGDFWQGRRFDNLTLAIQAARSGMGVIMTPRMLVEQELAQGALAAPLGFADVDRGTWVVVSAARREEPAIALFRRWLLDEAAVGG